MRRSLSLMVLVGAALTCMVAAGAARSPEREPGRFRAVDVWVDSSVPVAAWQIEVRTTTGDAQLVGIEGGEGPFAEPAYYDPRALGGGRIVLAAFTTGQPLPAGRHRVARLHLREADGPAEQTAYLVVAAGADGEPVAAAVSLGGSR